MPPTVPLSDKFIAAAEDIIFLGPSHMRCTGRMPVKEAKAESEAPEDNA